MRHAIAYVLLLSTAGCKNAAIPPTGNKCSPERVPSDGFESLKIYLETDSMSCGGDPCLVYQLNGDPSCTREDCDPTDVSCAQRCAPRNEIERNAFCSCRCDGPAGAADTCECPTGFTCMDVTSSDPTSTAASGGYCVRDSLL